MVAIEELSQLTFLRTWVDGGCHAPLDAGSSEEFRAAEGSLRSLLEMQNVGSHPRLNESEYLF